MQYFYALIIYILLYLVSLTMGNYKDIKGVWVEGTVMISIELPT